MRDRSPLHEVEIQAWAHVIPQHYTTFGFIRLLVRHPFTWKYHALKKIGHNQRLREASNDSYFYSQN